MDIVFHILFPVLIVGCLFGGFTAVRRRRQMTAAWESGVTARARVTRAWAVTRMVNDVPRRIPHHEYDFTTADGRAVRFEEAGGVVERAVGDEVLVYYAPGDPDRATAAAPDEGSVRYRVLLVLIAAGVVIMTKVMIQYW